MKYRKTMIGFVIVVLVIVLFVLKTLRDAGEFKDIKSHCACECTPVKGVPGPEDIVIDPELKIAFISSDNRRAALRGEKVQGAIYAYSLESKTVSLINLTPALPFEFHPHGIDLYNSPGGKKLLFVVNHSEKGHFIEIFEFSKMKLNHLKSINGHLMTSPNDVAAVGPGQFYVTNDHGATSALGITLENYLQLSISYVLFYNGSKFSRVAEGIAYANGIALSGNGATLYVAATVGRYIRVYARNRESGALKFQEDIDTGTGVDNIDVDKGGNLWVGCHPKLLTFVKHQKDSSKIAPSQVLKITPGEKGRHDIKEIYLNKGGELSASSVAVIYNDRMLMGAVFDDHFLHCMFKK